MNRIKSIIKQIIEIEKDLTNNPFTDEEIKDYLLLKETINHVRIKSIITDNALQKDIAKKWNITNSAVCIIRGRNQGN